ncbi:MAG: dUTP diphosphatase [Treponema sp.]|jgi:dUTP pyrophosphatase|nr:dUTP diphosphatase [Treponema sp.]
MEKNITIPCTAAAGALLPVYKTDGAACADISAFLEIPVTIAPGKTAVVPTGLRFALPAGFEIQVRPRSGLAAKNGITVLNTPGTIDSDYRGEIKVILINLGSGDFTIRNGDRIAQIAVSPVTRGIFCPADKLDQTDRGTGGFGSTGVASGT